MEPIPQRRFLALVDRFSGLDQQGHLEKMRQRKWRKADAAHALIQDERLQSLTLEEADELHRSLPISQRRRQEFLSNPVEEIRECLWFLLYEEAPYEIRVWEFLDEMGGYKINGGDLALVGALLCTQNPQMYGLINSNAEKGLRMLGMFPVFDRGESQAGKFQKVQEALGQIRGMADFQDFRVTDDFLEALAKGLLGRA